MVSISAFLLIAAGICRQIRPDWGYWPMLAAFLAAGVGFGLDHLVLTDSEKIEAVIDTCRDSALAGSMEGMEPVISDRYFEMAHRSKQALLEDGNRILSRIAINAIHIKSHTIKVRGRQAQSDLRLRVFLDPQRSEYPMAGGLMLVHLAVHYQKDTAENWQITQVQLMSVNNQSMDWGDAH